MGTRLKSIQMIKALIFDFGNVFLNLDLEKGLRDSLKHFNIESFSEEMLIQNHLYEKGLITTGAFLDFYSNRFPNISKQTLIELWNSILKDFPEHRLKFLQQLASEKKYKLILLSNTNELHIDWVESNISFYNTFKNCFDAFYLSHEIGFRKPENSIFEFVLNENSLMAYECLFIDDTKEHILSASQLGIHTWNINPKTDDITDLFKFNMHLF